MTLIPKRDDAYWAVRAQHAAARAYNSQDVKTARFLQSYSTAYSDIVKETSSLYAKYSREGKLSRSELHKYKRYQSYQKQIQGIVRELGGREERFCKKSFSDLYTEASKSIGSMFGVEFSIISKREMNAILEFPWSGENYSDRIWHNKDKLVRDLERIVIRGAVTGQSITDMTDDLKSKCEASAADARRLIRTETMHFINQGQLKGYKDGGFTEVMIMVAPDERTCPDCNDLDGMTYPINEADFVLPVHPNCRCTFVPVTGTRDMDSLFSDYEQEFMLEEEKERDVVNERGLSSWGSHGGHARESYNEPKLIGRADISKDGAIERIIGYHESKIVDIDHEEAIVVAQDGSVYRCVGDRANVYPEALGEKLKGAIVTHNHPEGEGEHTFSDPDIRLFELYELKELRGVEKAYVYTIKNDGIVIEPDAIPVIEMTFEDARHISVAREAMQKGYHYERYRR